MDPATLSTFTQLGVAGIVCAVLVWVILDQRATIREQKAELRENNRVMVEQVVPLATRMLDALKESHDMVTAAAIKAQER